MVKNDGGRAGKKGEIAASNLGKMAPCGYKSDVARKIVLSPWLMLGATGALFLVVALGVDLRPVVDENFFFAASDPAFQQAKKIATDV